MKLLIDAGNTRIKAALWDGEVLSGHISAEHRVRGPAATLVQMRDRFPDRLDAVVAGNVAGASMAAAIQTLCTAIGPIDAQYAAVKKLFAGLRIAYRQPERMGVDRWLAMLGGRASFDGPLLIVDAGTALTIDAITSDGQHLGGLIAAGRRLMCDSLIGQTADIDAGGLPDQLPPLFAADTGPAVAAGAAHALLALVRHARDDLRKRLDEAPKLILTGGDAPLIAQSLRGAEYIPDLVLRGLAVIADA